MPISRAPMPASWRVRRIPIVRPPNNPYVNRWIDKVRTRISRLEQIPKGVHGTSGGIFARVCARANAVCIMVDQRASEGIPRCRSSDATR